MRFFILLAISFICQFGFSQKQTDKDKGLGVSLEALYGYNLYSNSLHEQINTLSNFKAESPIAYVGLRIPDYYFFVNNYKYLSMFTYCKFIPKKIQVADTLNMTITGFNFSANLLYYNFFKKNKIVDLKLGLGFTTGRLLLHSTGSKIQNPFFHRTFLFIITIILKNALL